MTIREILDKLGYKYTESEKSFHMLPLYRDSDNTTALAVFKENGRWIDFVEGTQGDIQSLIKRTLNHQNPNYKGEFTKDFKFSPNKILEDRIQFQKIIPLEYIDNLESDHNYWINRGIDKDILTLFKSGVCNNGMMKNRYVFPIFNSSNKLIGLSGRDLTNSDKRPKWKHVGQKTTWDYPSFINLSLLKETRKVILVESIGDMLALWNAGIRNTLITFGVSVGNGVLNLLLKIEPKIVIIAFNNDTNKKDNPGFNNALKVRTKLNKFFDKRRIHIKLPNDGDFGDMNKQEIQQWAKT